MNTSKKTRFKKLANKRVNNVVNQIRVLSNLSNKSYYDYSEQDVKKIFKEIDEQLRIAKNKFTHKRRKFSL